MTRPAPAFRYDWLSKALAGTMPGLALSLALAGLFAWLGPGGIDAPDKVQFNMWLIPMLWMTFFSLVWLCRSGMRAWLWLGGANLLAWPALMLARGALGG